MKKIAVTLIWFFVLFVGATSCCIGQAIAENIREGSEVDNAWREGFAAGLAEGAIVTIEDSLNFNLPSAAYNGVMFSGAFNFNGVKWELENSSLSIIDNVRLVSIENDGDTIKLKPGDILRLKMLNVCGGEAEWAITKDYDKDILLLYKQIDTRQKDQIPQLGSGGMLLGGNQTQEWVFLCGRQGRSQLEFSNDAYYATPCHDAAPKTITFDIDVE